MDINTPSPITTVLRDLMKGLGGFLTATGLVSGETWSTVTGIVLFVGPAAYAIWKQIKMRETLGR